MVLMTSSTQLAMPEAFVFCQTICSLSTFMRPCAEATVELCSCIFQLSSNLEALPDAKLLLPVLLKITNVAVSLRCFQPQNAFLRFESAYALAAKETLKV